MDMKHKVKCITDRRETLPRDNDMKCSRIPIQVMKCTQDCDRTLKCTLKSNMECSMCGDGVSPSGQVTRLICRTYCQRNSYIRYLVYVLVIWMQIMPAACSGTTNQLPASENVDNRYNRLKEMYENCTYVDGNLEITWLDSANRSFNLSFLENIQEVTGYVMFMGVHADSLNLPNLRIIRGQTLTSTGAALHIQVNYQRGANELNIGLKELGLKSLHEILHGDVLITNNNQLCYENTINWQDIISGEGAHVRFHYNISAEDEASYEADRIYKRSSDRAIRASHNIVECPDCHPECMNKYSGHRHCWGSGPAMCQNLTRVYCSPQCEGHCFNEGSEHCCHPQCAGGCSGPLKTDCWACKNFRNDGECVPHCPRMEVYNPTTFQWETNPDRKLTYGSLCVSKCPSYVYELKDACVKDCGTGMYNKQGICMACDGPCPKACDGHAESEWVDAENIGSYENCTIIKGSLRILQVSFDGLPSRNISGITAEQLTLLESVKEVNGFVRIEGQSEHLKNLSFLHNLETIWGHNLASGIALTVMATSVETLELTSLKTVHAGHVYISKNYDLCFADDKNFIDILGKKSQILINENRDPSECEADGLVCDEVCDDSQGCWGLGPDKCLKCANFRFGNTCVASCDVKPLLYDTGNQSCEICHEECDISCTGPGADTCERCRHFQDGPYCVKECPGTKYPNSSNHCMPCHPFCVQEEGCNGPWPTQSEKLQPGQNPEEHGSCVECQVGLFNRDTGNRAERCLDPDLPQPCPAGYYLDIWRGIKSCRRCHELCKECNGHSDEDCTKCAFARQDGECVEECDEAHYVDLVTMDCLKCDPICASCDGPNATFCVSCIKHRVYVEPLEIVKPDPNYVITRGNLSYYCVDECPEHKPGTSADNREISTDSVCIIPGVSLFYRSSSKEKVVMGSVIGVVSVITIILCLIGVVCYRKKMRTNAFLEATFGGMEESEPLTPTGAIPDMASLRLIKESEVRRDNIIGSGAFGTVYKGYWVPEGEGVKIPVAIKVLQEGTASQNKEILEEARIMTSVNHPHCIRILAMCMTAQIMLITQLMPHGCLLEYVQKHKNNLGSKTLLNWCVQIARGMDYLEEKGIVHRDLAARNVLVQGPSLVKITDFGLAKLLDYNEDEYKSSGGKMPIKWLALECIQHRIFTHKSDVWSYGVTVWEIFTGGNRPYETIRALDVADLLEKGERLPQPSMCTIDVYMIMIKCWMLDAESRPSFKELADEFSKMARDPGRYLVIHGDALLRLPSHCYEPDADNVIGSMQNEGPEEVVDAEDYLMPQTDVPIMVRGVQPNGNLDRIQEDSVSFPTDSCSISDSPSGDHPMQGPKHGSLEAAAAARKQRPMQQRDSVSSRYTTEPRKPNMNREEDIPTLPAPPAPPPPNDRPLPLDEDDYLQPKSTNHPAYMDVIDAKDYLEPREQQEEEGGPEGYLDMNLGTVENPEYFVGSGAPPTKSADIAIDYLKKPKQNGPAKSNPDYINNEYDKLNHNKPNRPNYNSSISESVV